MKGRIESSAMRASFSKGGVGMREEWLTAFVFHVRCAFAAGASHMEWTLLRQCRLLFTQEHLVPAMYVLLPDFMRSVATWSTPLALARERDTAGGGSMSSKAAKKKKDRESFGTIPSSVGTYFASQIERRASCVCDEVEATRGNTGGS